MRFARNIVGAMLGLGLLNVCLGQQPGDTLQTRIKTELSVNGNVIGIVARGGLVTVKQVDKAEPDFLWCEVANRSGWIARNDLMTCQDAVAVWQEMIEAGDGNAYFSLGAAHNQLGEFERSEEDFNACVWRFPDSVPAINCRASARMKIGQPEKAERDWTVSIRMRPAATTYSNRADTRLILGDGEGALADCDQALQLEPKNLFAIINRGNAERLLGHFDKAIADYERATAIDRKSFGVNRNYAFLRAACPDPQYRDGGKAMELAKRACEAAGYRDSWSLSSLAAAAAETGDWDAAVKWETEAIAHDKLKRNEREHKRRLESYQAKQPFRFKVGEPVLDD